jgi:acyl dehydratase
MALYLEDLTPGMVFTSATHALDAEQIKEFAQKYDPQPFHLDDAAAAQSIFAGLAASGWHTAALTMRLLVPGEFRPAGGIVGFGGELNWLKPVRPGDELHVEAEILETRISQSRPREGLVKVRVSTFNQHGEPVQTFTPTLLVTRRSD